MTSVLQPLLAAGVGSASLGEVVVGKAVEKVMGRHAGAVDGGFLVREYAAITRLVTSLVDHYQQKRQRGRECRAGVSVWTGAASSSGPEGFQMVVNAFFHTHNFLPLASHLRCLG